MSTDIKKQNLFHTLPKKPFIFLLILFFHVLVVIVLNFDAAEIHSPTLFTVANWILHPNNGKNAVSGSSEVKYLEKKTGMISETQRALPKTSLRLGAVVIGVVKTLTTAP